MKIVTISREFGSGGRELGKRLADELGFDYYDKEIIASVAKRHGLDEKYVEKTLDNHAWRNIPITFGRSFAGISVTGSVGTNLLLEQKRVIEGIAKLQNDCVIVGRNADIILANENLFNIFVYADIKAKVRRCMERAESDEKLTKKEIEHNMRRIDKNRAAAREIITGGRWGDHSTYHLTVNTTEWSIKELTPAVAEFVRAWFGRK